MKRRRVRNSLWILMMVLMMLLPTEVPAADKSGSGRSVVVTRTYVDPRFADEISEAELENALGRSTKNRKATVKTCTTEAEAAALMRTFLVKRQSEFSIPVRLKVKKTSGEKERQEELEKIMDRIRRLAFAETDKPYEGDYMSQLKGYSQQAEGSFDGDYFKGTFEYFAVLMTTAAQEKEVDVAVAGIMKELALDGKTEYEKARAVYDYICSHTTYDHDGMDTDVAYTAYSILVRKKGTCDGYSKAIYRLMREAGLGCRYLSAYEKGKNVGHAWNIVRIGKLWYYVDATWDTSLYEAKMPYRFFLKGSKDRSYVEHETYIISLPENEPDFWKVHPLSESDYPYTDPEPTGAPEPEPDNVPDIPGVPAIKIGINRLTLTWEKEKAAVSYSVFRSVNGGAIRKIATTSNTSCTDKNIKSGNEYTYYLAANGKKGYQTEKTAPHIIYYLSPPEKLIVKATKNRTATLTWKKTRGATGYQIRYSLSKDMKSSAKTSIKNGSTLKKIVKNLKKRKYYFQIRSFRAFPGFKVYSAWSPNAGIKIS